MSVGPHMRARTAALVLLALLPALICASAAPAIAAATTTTTTAKCPLPQILNGMSTTGATVTTPGAPKRALDANQATAFMQTWLAYSVFENPAQNHPPANLPVSQLDVSVVANQQPQSLIILYATDGTKVWVGAPASPGAPASEQKWILAPEPAKTTNAFLGKMAPICIDPASSASTTAPHSTTTTHVAEKSTGSDDGATWALIGVGAVVIAAIAFVVTRTRRRAHAA